MYVDLLIRYSPVFLDVFWVVLGVLFISVLAAYYWEYKKYGV
jgi:Mg2+ and Co2+ transporter CorA